jgi:4,5-dihydroxyphthalate decarboxylase
MEMPLTVALQRSDRTEALFRGTVSVQGYEVQFVDPPVSEIFNRMLRDGAFDASEMSFAYGLIAHGRGEPPLVTLPFYPYRTFRQSSLFVRTNGSVHSPTDLPGKTFAVHDFFAADPLWIRGMLRDQFGVDPRDIRWLQYTFRERLRLPELAGYQLEYAIDADPTELLLSGRADALFYPGWPAPLRATGGEIEPLFADPLAAELGYFRETGILPLLHGFVLRRDVHEAQPGLAMALYEALVASRNVWYDALYTATSPLSGLPLFTSLALTVRQTLGLDFWPSGLGGNRTAVDKGIGYAVADGLLDKSFDAAELFPAQFRDT